jgi:hypothetical protein
MSESCSGPGCAFRQTHLAARELWTGPVSLWFRTLVGTVALAFVFGVVGVGAAEQFLSGIAHSVAFVAVLLGGMWAVPRIVEETPLATADTGETPDSAT